MKEEHILKETALLAREKGFDWDVDSVFDEQNEFKLISFKDHSVNQFFSDIDNCPGYEYHYSKYLRDGYFREFHNDDEGWFLSAPTQAHLQKWLREVHYLNIEIMFGSRTWKGFGYYHGHVHRSGDGIHARVNYAEGDFYPETDLTHEQCLEKLLVEALKLIKNEKETKN